MKDAMEASLRNKPLSALPAEFTIRDHFAIIALSQLISLRLDETSRNERLWKRIKSPTP